MEEDFSLFQRPWCDVFKVGHHPLHNGPVEFLVVRNISRVVDEVMTSIDEEQINLLELLPGGFDHRTTCLWIELGGVLEV